MDWRLDDVHLLVHLPALVDLLGVHGVGDDFAPALQLLGDLLDCLRLGHPLSRLRWLLLLYMNNVRCSLHFLIDHDVLDDILLLLLTSLVDLDDLR